MTTLIVVGFFFQTMSMPVQHLSLEQRSLFNYYHVLSSFQKRSCIQRCTIKVRKPPQEAPTSCVCFFADNIRCCGSLSDRQSAAVLGASLAALIAPSTQLLLLNSSNVIVVMWIPLGGSPYPNLSVDNKVLWLAFAHSVARHHWLFMTKGDQRIWDLGPSLHGLLLHHGITDASLE